MNGPDDFAELRCSEARKRRIATLLQVWNLSHEQGGMYGKFVMPPVHAMNGPGGLSTADNARRRYRRAGRELGLLK